MRKTTKKGFTLMELIIVMALFSVIMVLVMSFIDPASKLMNKTATREKTASYVDNINEYIDKSLRYATFVRVFESDLRLRDDEKPVADEKEAVQQFLDDFFDGAINSSGDPVTGRVHVLKLLNEPKKDTLTKNSTYDGVAGSALKDGALVDVVYEFKAGDSKPDVAADGVTPIQVFGGAFKNAEVTGPISNSLAVNPEHFQNYSYFYKLGFYEFIPVSDRTVTTNNPATASASYDGSLITKADGTPNLYTLPGSSTDAIPLTKSNQSDFYYKELIPMRDSVGSIVKNNKWSFAITTVAYPNDSKGDNKVICNKTYTDDSSVTESTSIFKSPCYMATSSMALANISPSLTINRTCVMKDQDSTGAEKPNSKLVPVTVYGEPFNDIPLKAKATDPDDDSSNIYFVYVVPSEINN